MGFLKQIRAAGRPMEEIYFEIDCDAGKLGNSFDLLRYTIRKISTHSYIAMTVVDEFYSERDDDPDQVSKEEREARALPTCAVTTVYRNKMNIMQEIDDRVAYINRKLADDPDFKKGTDDHRQAVEDLENLAILKKDLEYTIKTYPTTLVPSTTTGASRSPRFHHPPQS